MSSRTMRRDAFAWRLPFAPTLASALASASASAFVFAVAACTRQDAASRPIVELSGPTMGSSYTVKWHGDADRAAVATAVREELSAADATFSTWRDDSELVRLNAAPPGQPFPVSPRLAEALRLALRLAECTDGAFDPTVKPLVDVYRDARRAGTVPDRAAMAAAAAHVGYRRLRLDGDAVVTADADVAIDLDGVVAGLCADRLAARLQALGVADFLLEITGEMLVHGEKPDGTPWRVGIVDPARAEPGAERPILDFPLRDRALCTSGGYRNFTVQGGEVVTHVFDPRTGENPRHGVVSVSVLARSCALADGLATALLVTGPDGAAAALAGCGDDGAGAWFVLAAPDGSFATRGVRWPEAFALDGRPLPRPELPAAQRAERQEALAAAEQAFAAAPDDVGAAIAVGRRLGYLGRFRDAIAVYTEALQRHPDEPHLLRHRGHRFLTVRELEAAERDLARAAELVRGTADEVEPDGLPVPGRPPHSTLQCNVHYHLGLARFLRGDFAGAEAAWRDCLATVRNDEARVAATHWLWCALARQGRQAEARPFLDAIPAAPDVVENVAYLQLCRLDRGDATAASLAAAADAQGAALAFGLAHGALVRGDRDAAFARFTELAQRPDWPSFGVLAAEAELARRPATDRSR